MRQARSRRRGSGRAGLRACADRPTELLATAPISDAAGRRRRTLDSLGYQPCCRLARRRDLRALGATRAARRRRRVCRPSPTRALRHRAAPHTVLQLTRSARARHAPSLVLASTRQLAQSSLVSDQLDAQAARRRSFSSARAFASARVRRRQRLDGRRAHSDRVDGRAVAVARGLGFVSGRGATVRAAKRPTMTRQMCLPRL